MELIKTPEITTTEAIKALRKELVSTLSDNVSKVVFFGSRRRGIFGPDSDIDLLIVLRQKTKELVDRVFEISNMIEEDVLHYEIPLTIHIITEDEYHRFKESKSPFILSIEREGMVIYERTTQS